MIARRVIVRGRVQGVYYRAATVEAAGGCGVAGWVRNRRDGTVEALIEGDADAVARLIEWCRRGPPAAQVTAIDIIEVEVTGAADFRIAPSA
jgi:acylphosphatase